MAVGRNEGPSRNQTTVPHGWGTLTKGKDKSVEINVHPHFLAIPYPYLDLIRMKRQISPLTNPSRPRIRTQQLNRRIERAGESTPRRERRSQRSLSKLKGQSDAQIRMALPQLQGHRAGGSTDNSIQSKMLRGSADVLLTRKLKMAANNC